MTFLVSMICRAHNVSPCHLGELNAAGVTSLECIQWRTFFSDVLTIAEMLITRTCPVLGKTAKRFLHYFFLLSGIFVVINYCCSCLCRFTSEAGCGRGRRPRPPSPHTVSGSCQADAETYSSARMRRICLHREVIKTVSVLKTAGEETGFCLIYQRPLPCDCWGCYVVPDWGGAHLCSSQNALSLLHFIHSVPRPASCEKWENELFPWRIYLVSFKRSFG